MDIEIKKQEVKEDLARQPSNVLFSRIDIINDILLSNLLRSNFTPYLVQAANTSHSNSDSIHTVCVNLAKQRALLQGAAVGDVINFDIGSKTDYSDNGTLSYPKLEDSSYSNKTTLPYIVLHDLNEDGGIVNLSSTSNANTEIADDDGNNVKYFTDFSKYFLTRSRANGELISIDENNAPYTTPTAAEPFFPANTINGETYTGTATDPTANSDVRHDFFLTANTTAVGFAGANNDITENKYEGNTFVTLELSNVSGTFSASETMTDFDGLTATVKTVSNTTTLLIETSDTKGTFTVGETLTDLSTNATIQTVETVSNTEINITLTGSTFITGSNTSLDLGFTVANTITLDENTVVRTGSKVVVTANNHGVTPGEYIVLKGADEVFGEFNDTFSVEDVTQNTLSFSTSNSVSVTPTGDFSLVKNIVFGRTSNASAAIHTRTVNSSANVVFQSSDLNAGFAVGNVVTGSSSSATGVIDKRTKGGSWYQVKTNEVKTYYIASDSGTWDYDASNNPQGIESTANTGEFWLKNFEMVKINQIVDSSGSGDTFTAKKLVLDIALATSSDTSGGYDSRVRTNLPGVYFSYPMKTYTDQTHNGVVTLEAFNNFANIVIAPEGLEINLNWRPLANSSGVATNSTHINQDGSVTSSEYNPEECTTLDKSEFNAHLGPFETISTNPSNDVFRSSNPNTRSSALKVGTSGAVFPNVNTNPFFPAVGGTHKNHSNTANGLTGTQPSTLNANDIYAGTYTEIQTGAVDPGPNLNFRYIIQNDLKWIYATNPFASRSTGSGQNFSTPRSSAYQVTYDGYSKSGGFSALITSVSDQDATSHSHDNTIPADSAPSGYPGATPPTLTTQSITVGGQPQTITVYQSHSGTEAAGTYTWDTSTEDGTTNKVTTARTQDSVSTIVDDSLVTHYQVSRSTSSITDYTYNVVQDVLTDANTATYHTLLTNLNGNDSTYGAAYEDPLEDALGGSRIITDSSFESAAETALNQINAANTYHQGVISGTDNNYTNGQAHTYANTSYNAFITGVSTFKTALEQRITEISNRIGYVNGKDVADGGSGTKSTGYNTSNGGFAGYTFNNGKGYANTIYSQSNFLAGKKLKIIENIVGAINDIQSLYDQIKAKRAEYYEYNQ